MTFAPDVSKFQRPVDDTFNRDYIIFRVCFDGTIDDNAQRNLAWARQAVAAGKIKGFAGYVVPLSGSDSNQRCLNALDAIDFPTDQVVMIDAEKWGGASYEIFGDHSSQFNALAVALRKRQGGNDDLVWAYGNRGPDLIVWPNKADWLGWVVAGYTSGDPTPALPANAIGWQYTNGQPEFDNPNRPNSTPPFGRCDHNIIFKLPGDDLPLTDNDADTVWSHPLSDGTTTQPASAWLKQGDKASENAVDKIKDLQADVHALQKSVAVLTAAVTALKVAPVDPAALAVQLAQHLDLKVVTKP